MNKDNVKDRGWVEGNRGRSKALVLNFEYASRTFFGPFGIIHAGFKVHGARRQFLASLRSLYPTVSDIRDKAFLTIYTNAFYRHSLSEPAPGLDCAVTLQDACPS